MTVGGGGSAARTAAGQPSGERNAGHPPRCRRLPPRPAVRGQTRQRRQADRRRCPPQLRRGRPEGSLAAAAPSASRAAAAPATTAARMSHDRPKAAAAAATPPAAASGPADEATAADADRWGAGGTAAAARCRPRAAGVATAAERVSSGRAAQPANTASSVAAGSRGAASPAVVWSRLTAAAGSSSLSSPAAASRGPAAAAGHEGGRRPPRPCGRRRAPRAVGGGLRDGDAHPPSCHWRRRGRVPPGRAAAPEVVAPRWLLMSVAQAATRRRSHHGCLPTTLLAAPQANDVGRRRQSGGRPRVGRRVGQRRHHAALASRRGPRVSEPAPRAAGRCRPCCRKKPRCRAHTFLPDRLPVLLD